MTITRIAPPSSTMLFVTPHKVHRDRKFHQQRAFFPSLPLASPPRRFRTVEQLDHLSAERQESKRVFQCLSNTTTTATSATTTSTSTSTSTTTNVSPETAAAQSHRSALKHMFQPPRATTSLDRQQQRIASVFFGCQLDLSTLTHTPLRASGKKSQQSSQRRRGVTQAAVAEQTLVEAEETSPTTSNTNKSVHFQNCVTVVRIPSHRDYDAPLKQSVFCSLKNIKANAIRNTAEFIHDRCNWRKASEEDCMYRDTRSGAFIHPVHVQRYHAAWQKHQKKKQLLQLEKKQPHITACALGSGDENETKQQPASTGEAKEERPIRKRVRCCSPSPIRRSLLPSSSSSSPDGNNTEHHHRHEPKRQRRIQSPVPSRRRMMSHGPTIIGCYPQQQQQQPLSPTPTSSYAHASSVQQQPMQQENGGLAYYQQQHTSYWQQQQQPTMMRPFSHPSSSAQ